MKKKILMKMKDENIPFSCKQKLSLLLFALSFGVIITGIMVFDWWFEHMSALFLAFAIVFIILLRKGKIKTQKYL